MEAAPAAIDGLLLFTLRKYADSRGYFFESWSQQNFDRLVGTGISFCQDNFSFSRKDVLRGLHLQREPCAQGKLVSVPSGKIFDVAVDLRPGSVTFGKHYAVELSSEDNRALWIPEGFAHGFLVMSDHALVHYKVTKPYSPGHEASVRWDDSSLSIPWPLQGKGPVVSEKDGSAPGLADLQL